MTDGTSKEQLTNNGAINWAHYWHLNRKFIAYTTFLYEHYVYAIELLNIKTRATERITYGNTFDGLPVFSHDGKKLLWTSKRGNDRTCQIFIADFTLN